ncbi:COP9 signalosome complex subunit 7 [Tetranychus urticae]|uniref:PCI domain-containing protein n=1 Tax=Tetranychus urticae TaxID=32264 RepID=T1K2T2_TETUR|nr:COP9 signalosome complex subunit 7 [Tetranychus urticae]
MEVDSPPVTTSALQQFIVLSKASKGLAAVELIKQVLNHPQIYVFGELLRQPNIKELADSEDHRKYYELLELFAYGNYCDYNETKYPPLTQQMITKLRHLTVVNLASKNKILSYDKLNEELGIDNLRELENLIIDVIYSNIIKGKMDQENGWLEISSTISRDIKEEQLETIITVLSDWCSNCENVIADIESQIIKANSTKSAHSKEKQELEAQISSIEMHLKNSGQDIEFSQDNSDMNLFMSQASNVGKTKRTPRRSNKPSGPGTSRDSRSFD